MSYHVVIPARLASTRLDRKPLAEIGGVAMIVRVARRASQSNAASVVVACDDAEIEAVCAAHGVRAVLTSRDHATGSDRLAEAVDTLAYGDDAIVVNVQGDEPMIEPGVIDACARLLAERADCAMSTVAHAIASRADFVDPNVVKVVLDASGRALYFSRAPIPFVREASRADALPAQPPLHHVGLYAYRAGFVRRFPRLERSPLEDSEKLEQLRVLWHGERIAVHVAAGAAGIGVDTPEDLARIRAEYAARGGAGFA